MRPAGEISAAIMQAASDLERVDDAGVRHGPTLRELAHKACVGTRAAVDTVKNLRRAGKLEAVADRRVAYRSRPVKEWAPSRDGPSDEVIDVASVFAVWAEQA
jgi:hypothetical protein